MRPKLIPLVWGAISIAAAILVAVSMHNFFGYLIATVLTLFGWHSLKSAAYMTDSEIREFTNSDLTKSPSKETESKFRDL